MGAGRVNERKTKNKNYCGWSNRIYWKKYCSKLIKNQKFRIRLRILESAFPKKPLKKSTFSNPTQNPRIRPPPKTVEKLLKNQHFRIRLRILQSALPKMLPRWPKMPPRRPETLPRRPKTPSYGEFHTIFLKATANSTPCLVKLLKQHIIAPHGL